MIVTLEFNRTFSISYRPQIVAAQLEALHSVDKEHLWAEHLTSLTRGRCALYQGGCFLEEATASD